jgi:hypothetical protein
LAPGRPRPASRPAADGPVTCQIIIDAVEIAANTSHGAYKIATCQGRVP